MDKPKSSQKFKQKILASVFATLLAVCFSGSVPSAHAFGVGGPATIINNVSYGTVGSFNVVKANITNNWASSLDLVVFAVVANTITGQKVAIATGGLTLASGATGTTFCPLMDEFPSGSYVIIVFAVDTSNNPVSVVVTLPLTT